MIINTLKIEIEKCLKESDEIWCALALVNDNGFEFIQSTIHENCIQHYLIGIDLPTSPSVLRKMQARQHANLFEASIYKSQFSFHPKVYLLKSKDTYTAFVGSSNLTDGGLNNNVEVNYKIKNQDKCLALLNWFNNLSLNGFPLTDENISEYENQYNSITELQDEIRLKRKHITLKKPQLKSNLDVIDFTDRYFKKEHHWAFRKELWYSDSENAIEERESAKKRCIELHETIFKKFKDYGIQILEPNPMPDHLISMIRQIDPLNPRILDAIWLSYGKSGKEIKVYQNLVGQDQKSKQTFIHHARLQVRVDLNSIGIWLLFAKENEGGLFDREFFKQNMTDSVYREKFHLMIKSLPSDYFIIINDEKMFCHTFSSPTELHNFCKRDNNQKYFIIGKDYKITDQEMSETNLPKETLTVFKRLFPFYEIMRHRII